MKRIYLVLEVKSRELDSRLLFSIIAAQKNFSVVICKKAYLLSKLKYLKPGIIILKSMGKKNNSMILEAKKYGHKVCSMDEEGLLFWTPEIYCRKRIDEKVIDLIDYIFTWGKNDFDAISKIHPKHRGKLIITGNPRIDLLNKKYNKFYKEDSKLIKQKFNEFILINTNFGYVNHIAHPKQSIVDGIKKLGINDKEELNFHKKKLDTQITRFKMIKSFIEKFAIENKGKTIIIRPHQSEDDTIWKSTFESYKNVRIIRDGKASIPWMLASKVTISCNCTTGVEAKILGLENSLNFIPGDNVFCDYKLPNQVNLNIYSLDDLINSVKKILNNSHLEVYNYDQNILTGYINNIKNEEMSSTELVLKNIDPLFENISKKKDKYSNFFTLKYFYLKRFLINLYMKKDYQKNKISKLLLQKNPGTSVKEIDEKLKVMCSSFNQNKPKVKEIYPDVYCIEKQVN